MKRRTINIFLTLVAFLGTQSITSMSLSGMYKPTIYKDDLNK